MAGGRLDLDRFRTALLEERKRLMEQRRKLHAGISREDQSEETSDLADYDNHPADAASETFEREKVLAMDNVVDGLLARIERALDKIDQETYGVCDRCGREIIKERLQALPHAAFCVECQDIIDGR